MISIQQIAAGLWNPAIPVISHHLKKIKNWVQMLVEILCGKWAMENWDANGECINVSANDVLSALELEYAQYVCIRQNKSYNIGIGK